jgi:hypothetical protein
MCNISGGVTTAGLCEAEEKYYWKYCGLSGHWFSHVLCLRDGSISLSGTTEQTELMKLYLKY